MDIAVYVVGKLMVLLLGFGLLSTIRYALQRVWTKMGVKSIEQQSRLQTVTAVILLWLALLTLLSLTGFFLHFSNDPPRISWVLLPALCSIVIAFFFPAFRTLVQQIPESWLFYGQSYRILTDLFLWMGYLGHFVPLQMTFLWLNHDYTVGLTALLAGYTFFGGRRYRRFEGIIWNIFGLILLFNQVFIGYISLPTADQVFNSGISSVFLADFPFIWLWGLAVPFGCLLHTTSLYQLIFLKRTPALRRTFSLDRNGNKKLPRKK